MKHLSKYPYSKKPALIWKISGCALEYTSLITFLSELLLFKWNLNSYRELLSASRTTLPFFLSVIFLITRSPDVTQILIHAQQRGLFTKGYAFITVDFGIPSSLTDESLQSWGVQNKTDLQENYLQGLIYVSSDVPDVNEEQFKKLAKEAEERIRLEPFLYTANFTTSYQVNYFRFLLRGKLA